MPGFVEWFQPGEHTRVLAAVRDLEAIGARDLRTGFSWADYHTADGKAWYAWLFETLSAAGLRILPCFNYTPPSLGIEPKVSSPPRDPKAYADFIDEAITLFGEHFEYVELWNEPNNSTDWDYRLDPNWRIFSEMIIGAAYWARQRGKKTVLGGMSPFDPNWMALMGESGVIEHIDVVGIHGFPGTWDHEWTEWGRMIENLSVVLRNYNSSTRIWVTEAGYSAWRHDELEQAAAFFEAANALCERVYWYSLHDLHPDRSHQGGGFHGDERHYHLGISDHRGRHKLVYRLLAERGFEEASRFTARLKKKAGIRHEEKCVLITGGAGFIGTNLADKLCRKGHRVRIYDNLSRPGVEDNLSWLLRTHRDQVDVEIADVRDCYTLKRATQDITHAFHLAAQVAVTTSLEDPATDFEVNVRGTLNLLEALRAQGRRIPLLFTSTNKVYGCMEDVELERRASRYQALGKYARGVSEARDLDFHSPYGCSKGAADQYVLDYARSYGMPNTVFRMSCIYGRHQHGTEDQGWVAHFARRALEGSPITLYGDGLQVRDLLFADDLVEAMFLACLNGHDSSGQSYNIGGGIQNTLSLVECIELISEMTESETEINYSDWRTGDQRFYVSDVTKFTSDTGWKPRTGVHSGLKQLVEWLRKRYHSPAATTNSPQAR